MTHLEQITTPMVSDWLATLKERRALAGKTANGYREMLQRLINWAVNRGVRMPGGLNPAHEADRFKEHHDAIRFLTLGQIHAQLEALTDRPQVQTMVATLIYAGLRREELLRLTPKDVDLRRGYIRVRAKTIDGEFWQPKTGKERSVPVSSALQRYLEAYSPPRKATWHFPSPQGCFWDPDNFSAELRRLNGEAGSGWTCLGFRHTFGSHLATRGESLYKISKLMGNSPEICRRHYAALLPESLMGCVEFDVAEAETPQPDGGVGSDGRPELRIVG